MLAVLVAFHSKMALVSALCSLQGGGTGGGFGFPSPGPSLRVPVAPCPHPSSLRRVRPGRGGAGRSRVRRCARCRSGQNRRFTMEPPEQHRGCARNSTTSAVALRATWIPLSSVVQVRVSRERKRARAVGLVRAARRAAAQPPPALCRPVSHAKLRGATVTPRQCPSRVSGSLAANENWPVNPRRRGRC